MYTYIKNECSVFAKTGREYGELSNIHSKFPIKWVSGVIPSSEHLYQIMRFTHRPEIQQGILDEPRPMGSKFKAYESLNETRDDWDDIKVQVMSWVVKIKLHQHLDTISAVLAATNGTYIVEYSKKDDFWGAVKKSEGVLEGQNYLGRLWMKAREHVSKGGSALDLTPPDVGLKLTGYPINADTFK